MNTELRAAINEQKSIIEKATRSIHEIVHEQGLVAVVEFEERERFGLGGKPGLPLVQIKVTVSDTI